MVACVFGCLFVSCVILFAETGLKAHVASVSPWCDVQMGKSTGGDREALDTNQGHD